MLKRILSDGDRDHGAVIRQTTRICLYANIVLAALKFLGGMLGSSQAVIADAVHTLSDSVTDAAILVGVRHWTKPPDPDHPYGHRRIETIITISIGLALFAVGIGIAWKSIATLRVMHDSPPGWIAFWAAILSIAGKETMYRWSVAVGRRVASPSLIANAWHHRSDALSSVPAALAVAGSALTPAWWMLDHIGAIIVAVFITKAAWDIALPGLQQLIDTGAPRTQLHEIESLALSIAGVRQVHALRTRYAGPGLYLDLHVLVDPTLTVRQGHDIAAAVEALLRAKGPDVIDVIAHIEPYEGS